jgi:hypothetical protein
MDSWGVEYRGEALNENGDQIHVDLEVISYLSYIYIRAIEICVQILALY